MVMVLQLISRAFPALARTRTPLTGKFLDPMYYTSFFMIFRARHNGDGPTADFGDWARATAGKARDEFLDPSLRSIDYSVDFVYSFRNICGLLEQVTRSVLGSKPSLLP